MSSIKVSNRCDKKTPCTDDFLFLFWENYRNEILDDLLLVIQNIIAGTAVVCKKMLNETCLEYKMQLSSNSSITIFQYELKSDVNALDDLFLVIQNIVSGTVTMSKKMLSESCLEWKIQLSPNSPVFVLQYKLKFHKNDMVHRILVPEFKDMIENKEIVDETCIKLKSVIIFPEIHENPSNLHNFKQEIPELLSTLDYSEKKRNTQLVPFNSVHMNQTKMFSKINVNTASTTYSAMEADESVSYAFEREMISDMCTNLACGSNKKILYMSEENKNCEDKLLDIRYKEFIKNNLIETNEVNNHSYDHCKKLFNRKNTKQKREKIYTVERHLSLSDRCKRYIVSNYLFPPKSEKLFKCKECGESFFQSSSLVVHKRIHTSGKQFKCEQSGRDFTDSTKLVEHERTRTKEIRFKCGVCGKSFMQSSSLNVHKRIHTGEKRFKCLICEKSFTQSSSLKVHKRIHTKEKRFQCGECSKSFTQSSNLTLHKRIHTGEKPYKCQVCEKAFTSSCGLTAHKRIHSGDKPFTCGQCGKAFTQKSSLIQHIRIHTGEKPFKCEVCSKSFTQTHSLTIHKRIHTGEKPFKCNMCSKSFTTSSNLTEHARIHTSEKSFKSREIHLCNQMI